jgi:hypothetical protein
MKDLDALLREDAGRQLDDGGFTARVLGALPSHRRTSRWLRPALVMGSAVTGSALALAFAPAFESPSIALWEWIGSGTLSPAAVTSLAIGLVLLASAVVIALDSD